MKNSVFFPQSLLDILVSVEKLDLEGEELVIPESGFRYRVMEAVRITQEVTTGEDPHDLCGKVALRAHLTDQMGAEILGNSMLVEDNAYDVIPGMMGEPTGDVDPNVVAGKREEDLLTALQNTDDL